MNGPKKSILFIGLLYLVPLVCSAITYPWKIATSVSAVVRSDGVDYNLNLTTIDITDESILDSDTVGDILTRYTGSTSGTANWGTYHRHVADQWSMNASNTRIYSGARTELWADFARKVGGAANKITERHVGAQVEGECVGTTMWASNQAAGTFNSWIAKTWNGGAGAGAGCLGIPPANQWCALTTSAVNIDYGTINSANAVREARDANVNVNCTTGMKFTLRLQGEDAIPLSNGMKAVITANGVSLLSSLQGQSGDNPVTLTSTLSGTPTTSGGFKGAGVLFVSYP